jgi:nucleotide-binding universal stress UspA family protein
VAGAARYRRVIVGVDGSPGSRAALIHALAAGTRLSSEVEVVTSYARPVFWAREYCVDPPVPASLRTDTEARLAEFVDEVRRSPVPAGAPGADAVALRLVVSAHPAVDALVDRAADDDLLVVVDRGRDARGSAQPGSVALDCVNRTVGSILVVRTRVGALTTPPRVVVGIDGSAHSRATLTVALDEAHRTGAEVEVVHAYELTDHRIDDYSCDVPGADEIGDQAS